MNLPSFPRPGIQFPDFVPFGFPTFRKQPRDVPVGHVPGPVRIATHRTGEDPIEIMGSDVRNRQFGNEGKRIEILIGMAGDLGEAGTLFTQTRSECQGYRTGKGIRITVFLPVADMEPESEIRIGFFQIVRDVPKNRFGFAVQFPGLSGSENRDDFRHRPFAEIFA